MNPYERSYQGFIMFKHYQRSWAFPTEIEQLLVSETVEKGKSTLQLYGGMARFGSRLDIDPATRPDVIGNSLYPPFACKSFDVVVVDPPYGDLRSGIGLQILAPAACLARERIWWFHTHWSVGNGLGLRLLRWWSCSPCSLGAPMRILVEYQVTRHPKYCHAVARRGHGKKLPKQLRKYDWTRHFPHPVNREPLAVQQRMFA